MKVHVCLVDSQQSLTVVGIEHLNVVWILVLHIFYHFIFVMIDVSQIHKLWNATFIATSLAQRNVNIILFYMLKELDYYVKSVL